MTDGTIITAYYASLAPTHHRYHMGVVRWALDEVEFIFKSKKAGPESDHR